MTLPIISTSVTFENNKASTFDVTFSGNEFKLSTVLVIDGITIVEDEGYIEFPAIDLGQFYMNITEINPVVTLPAGTSIKVYTSTSSDAISYSSFSLVNPDKTITSPQARYIKVKIEFLGAVNEINITRNDFVDSESNRFNVDDQILMDGNMHLKTSYSTIMTAGSVSEGKLFSASLNKPNFKKINSVAVI